MLHPSLYSPLFYGVACAIGFFLGLRFQMSRGDGLTQQKESPLLAWGVAIIVAIWIGLRPISSAYFGDMGTYARMYLVLSDAPFNFNLSEEWMWDNISVICHRLGFGTEGYFTSVCLLYTLSAFAALRILVPKKPFVSLVLLFSSLMFLTFATNGMRNGLACHLTILAFALYLKSQRLLAAGLAFLAYGIHHSVGVPIAAFVGSLFIYKRPQIALGVWLLSIVASLTVGSSLTSFIEQFSVDDRLQQYANAEVGGVGTTFSSYGFRWEFLGYSAMPILLGYYSIVKRGLTDNWYSVLFSTYCLANAFWVIFIRAAFSNRFAYLSWFLYPVMIAYPLFLLRIWPDQDKKVGLILMAYVGFTAMMQFVYW